MCLKRKSTEGNGEAKVNVICPVRICAWLWRPLVPVANGISDG